MQYFDPRLTMTRTSSILNGDFNTSFIDVVTSSTSRGGINGIQTAPHLARDAGYATLLL